MCRKVPRLLSSSHFSSSCPFFSLCLPLSLTWCILLKSLGHCQHCVLGLKHSDRWFSNGKKPQLEAPEKDKARDGNLPVVARVLRTAEGPQNAISHHGAEKRVSCQFPRFSLKAHVA